MAITKTDLTQLYYNTMRFGTDSFAFNRQALLSSKVPFDATGYTNVEGFTISGLEPTGTSRRVIFKIDDKLYKFSGSNLVDYTGAGLFDDIILNGNTVDELAIITNIPEFVGKKIYPIIALEAPFESAVMPTIKIGLKVRSNTDVFEKTTLTPSYTLAADNNSVPEIADIVENVTTQGDGSVKIYVSIYAPTEGEDGESLGNEWSDWMPLSKATNKKALAVKFKFDFKVTTTSGADSAKVNSITIRHNLGATVVSGDFADLYSVIENYEVDLQTCSVVVKHNRLIDSRILVYVNFMEPTKTRERIYLGTADGTTQQFVLGVNGNRDENINQDSIRLFSNGQPFTVFDYNVEVSEVTLSTNAGAVITASYEYNHGKEIWREMNQVGESQPYLKDGLYMSRFLYSLSDDESVNQKFSNIRVRLERTGGHVSNESLGIATGVMQQFVLPHAAKQETIELEADWSYDPDSQILTVVAPKNVELMISYDYVGESVVIYGVTAGWSPAL